jgi:hypothetical protein
MRETLREEVSVNLVFDSRTKQVIPRHLKRRGYLHIITNVGLHHTYRSGRTLIHIFSVTDDTMFYRLELNTETLHWLLTEVSDGQPD